MFILFTNWLGNQNHRVEVSSQGIYASNIWVKTAVRYCLLALIFQNDRNLKISDVGWLQQERSTKTNLVTSVMVMLPLQNATKFVALCLIISYSFKKKFLVKTLKTTCTCEISQDLKQHGCPKLVRLLWQAPYTAGTRGTGTQLFWKSFGMTCIESLDNVLSCHDTCEFYFTGSVLRNDKDTKFYARDTHHSIILTTRM